jgi:hypothetical protein
MLNYLKEDEEKVVVISINAHCGFSVVRFNLYVNNHPGATLLNYAKTTLFLSVPILEIVTSICVPGTKYFGGLRPAPTPM